MASLEKMYLKQLYNKTSIYLSLSMKWSVYYYFALPILFALFFIGMNLLSYTCCLPVVTVECIVGFHLFTVM